METIRSKINYTNIKFIFSAANILIFALVIGWYTIEHSPPYKEHANAIYVKYFRPDHCVIKPWSEADFNVDSWRNNGDFPDICLLPEFIEKYTVTLYGLETFLKIQYNDKNSPMYKKPIITSTMYGTNFNGVLLDGTIMLHHPKEEYTNTAATIDCVNKGFDGSIHKFKTRRPYRVSFMTTHLQRDEIDFYGSTACLLTDYFFDETI